ncbi:MAG: PAS domain-containing protein [Candidatus Cloacimonetes bacterium]|nr:PAS domain-containing protein [Candidatus Cloacimonadota bacterium]
MKKVDIAREKLLLEIEDLKKQVTELEKEAQGRKQAENALRNSENTLRTLFNAMQDIVFEMDYNGTYLNIAPTSPDLMAKPPDEVIGKTLHYVFPKPEADRFLAFIRHCLDSNEQVTIEYPLVLDGKTHWFEGRATPKTKDTILYIARDVTAKKETEVELRVRESQYTRVYENSPFGIIICQPVRDSNERTVDLEFLQANQAAFKHAGISEENIIGKRGSDFCTPEELAALINVFQPILTNANIVNHSHYFSAFNRQLNLTVFRLSKDIYILDFVDVTEQQKVQLELKKNQELLSDIMSSVQDGISVLGKDLTIKHVNYVMKEWYKDQLPLEGKKCFQAYHLCNEICEACPSLRCMQTGKTEWEIVSGPKDSEVNWIELFSYPIRDKVMNEITGVVEFVRDITHRKIAEEELQKYREHLEELVNERTQKLEEQKKDLERMNKLFVGREFRIKELRDEIKRLKGNSETGDVRRKSKEVNSE